MKKRIKLTENQFTNLVRLNEELTNDQITKKYNLIDKRLASIWNKLADLSVQDIFNMASDLSSTKDEIEAIGDKIHDISKSTKLVLNKIEVEFGEDAMFTYDSHYNDIYMDVINKSHKLLDFVDSLINVSRYSKLEKVFPPVNI